MSTSTVTAIPTLENMDYSELLTWLSNNGESQQLNAWLDTMNSAGYDVSEMQLVEDYMANSGINFSKTADGLYGITGYGAEYQTAVNAGLPNSNVSSIARSKFTTMLNRGKTVANKLNITTRPAGGGFAANAAYFVGSAASAVGAVSTGIALGKTFDRLLYNANPNFWDEHGMSAINPETWNSITTGDDSWQAGLFNFIFGLDPATGNTQAYMDANAFALMALFMKEQGVFSIPGGTVTINDSSVNSILTNLFGTTTLPVSYYGTIDIKAYRGTVLKEYRMYGTNSIIGFSSGTTGYYSYGSVILASSSPFSASYTSYDLDSSGNVIGSYTSTINAALEYYNSQPVYYMDAGYGARQQLDVYVNQEHLTGSNLPSSTQIYGYSSYEVPIAYALIYGDVNTVEAIDGIGNQTGATLPDISTWNDVPSTLASLQQQYPDMFNDAIVWDNVQPDGSNPQLTYIPIPWPDISSYDDTQPVSSTSAQNDTLINSLVEPLVQTMMDLLRQTQTLPDTGIDTPPTNPSDTGDGSTSDPDIPTGSASALWSVYHPSQSEVNSFGAWLWGSPFVTNILKLFQSPIDGVLTLHKIFVTPTDSGTANIVVGTLDSGVSSATVNNQYEYVNCGSVDLYEYFGNVFDYPPFTTVHLYLPFIGIVQLDTNDVMRSTISITYGVDVFTGACLAMVNVTRDGNTVNMYQYSGVCSVEYPISSLQHSNMLSGLLAVASGVAGIATGGVSVPATMAVAGGAASAAKTSIGHSGGFSGNAGAMGIKNPYLIIQRPQTMVAEYFPELAGIPTNVSARLGDFSGQVVVTDVHVENIPATDTELKEIEAILKTGVLV